MLMSVFLRESHMTASATSQPKTDPCIARAKKIVAGAISETVLVRKHFEKGRPNNSQDSTVEGTVQAVTMLLKAYKRVHRK